MATDILSSAHEAALNDPRPRRWSREEYNQLGAAGFFAGQRVELIEGEILLMSPQGPGHASTVELVAEALRNALGAGYWVRTQLPLALNRFNEPEPDIAVVRGTPRTITEHPRTALLVVEVSGSTRSFDRGLKAREYAKAGIQDYWVVDLTTSHVVVHRAPLQEQFSQVKEYARGDKITLQAFPDCTLKVSDLLV